MKKIEKKEIFGGDIKSLYTRLRDARQSLFEMRLDLSQNKLKNTSQITTKKKEIAQILTVIREKEMVK